MKNLKTYMLASFIVLGATTVAIGQEGKENYRHKDEFPTHKRTQERKHQIKEISNLTEKQKEELSGLKLAFKEQVQALKMDESLQKEAKFEKMKTLRADHFKAMSTVLTEEQQAEMKARFANHKMNQGERKGQPEKFKKMEHKRADFKKPSKEEMVKMQVERLDKTVDLTDKQKVKVQSIVENYGDKKQAIWKDQNISKEEKQKAFKELRTAQQKEMDKVLTAKQKKVLEEQKQERTEKRKEFKKQNNRDAK